MHEYPITQQIIQTAEEYARAHHAARVKEIRLVIGDMSGCVAECIELYFDLIAQGSLCAEAKLVIERVTPKLRCGVCGMLFERKPFSFDCPTADCNGQGQPTEIGREFFVQSIQVE